MERNIKNRQRQKKIKHRNMGPPLKWLCCLGDEIEERKKQHNCQ